MIIIEHSIAGSRQNNANKISSTEITELIEKEWLEPYYRGFGIETRLDYEDAVAYVRTGISKEVMFFLKVFVGMAGLIGLGFVISLALTEPELFKLSEVIGVIFVVLFLVIGFAIWVLFLAWHQNNAVKKFIVKRVEEAEKGSGAR